MTQYRMHAGHGATDDPMLLRIVPCAFGTQWLGCVFHGQKLIAYCPESCTRDEAIWEALNFIAGVGMGLGLSLKFEVSGGAALPRCPVNWRRV